MKFQQELTELHPINSGVPQGSVLGPILYLLHTADMPTTENTLTATFADDTAILASHESPEIASRNLQISLNRVQNWMRIWRVKVNETKSTHVTFTLRRETCPSVILNNNPIPQADDVRYLGMHLDRRLTWRKHIFSKRKQLGLKVTKLYWLLGRKSKLTLTNKVLLYKTVLKPIWTYGVQLWGTASNSNIEILQRFQSKTLRTIADAPWYLRNEIIHNDLCVKTVKGEVSCASERYLTRLETHTNTLAVNLLDNSNATYRLNRVQPIDLKDRF